MTTLLSVVLLKRAASRSVEMITSVLSIWRVMVSSMMINPLAVALPVRTTTLSTLFRVSMKSERLLVASSHL